MEPLVFARAGQFTLQHRGAICWGGDKEGTVPLAQLSAGFQSLPLLPTIKSGPSGADSQVGGIVYVLGPCRSLQQVSCEDEGFFHCYNLHRVWGAFFSHPGTVSCVVYLAPQLFLPVYLLANVGLPGPPAAAASPTRSTSHHLSRCPLLLTACVHPRTSLNQSFFFNSLAVGLPYSLIFWQFWLFFVFEFVVVLLLVVQGGKYVYLCLHVATLKTL